MRRGVIRLGSRDVFALILVSVALSAGAEERVLLVPAQAPAWRAWRVLAALRDSARAPREVRIVTTPAAAGLELAYVRAGTELARAAGEAPLVATLPGRALTDESDRVVVRAQLAGFAARELTLDALLFPRDLRIELSPLPRTIRAVSLLELGEHAQLELVSDRPIDARLVSTTAGWRLVLADAGAEPGLEARLRTIRGRTLKRVEARAFGGDLFLELGAAANEQRTPRIARHDEAARAASHLALEWLPADRDESSVALAKSTLAKLGPEALGPCGAAFEDALVAELGRESLSRALAPRSAWPAAYVSLALERLAARSARREIALRDGTRIALDGDLARARATMQASDARGLLVALRALTQALAPAGDATRALHAWLSAESTFEEFSAENARAQEAEARCRRSS